MLYTDFMGYVFNTNLMFLSSILTHIIVDNIF
jgi:hypothetical protein